MWKYFDPTTDFGFKRLFGEEENLDLTASLINDVLALDSPLRDLTFPNTEQLPRSKDQRGCIFDVLCRDGEGNYYLVEMQKTRFSFIKDRMVYYATFPIAMQALKDGRETVSDGSYIRDRSAPYGEDFEKRLSYEASYEFKNVHCIAVMGFVLPGSRTAVTRSSLRSDAPPHDPFYEKLRFVTVELPLFQLNKPEYSLDVHLNKWLYFLWHARSFESIPEVFQGDPIFEKAFRVAEFGNLTFAERMHYEANLNDIRTKIAELRTSHEDGRAKGLIEGFSEGMLEGRLEMGRKSLALFFTPKLGPMPDHVAAAILQIKNPERLEAIASHFVEINDWDTLLKHLQK